MHVSLRTYRLLPALAALTLLLGVFLPVVQEVCAMGGHTVAARAAARACCCPGGHDAAAHPGCEDEAPAETMASPCCVQAELPRQQAVSAPLPAAPDGAALPFVAPLPAPDAPRYAPAPAPDAPAPPPSVPRHLLFSVLLT